MKIALLWPDFWPYIRRGTERMINDIATYLAEQGHEVDIIASKPGKGNIERRGPITIYRLPQVEHPLLRRLRPAMRFDLHGLMVTPLLLKKRYDLIHSFVFTYTPASKLASVLRGSRCVYHVVMTPPHWSRPLDAQLLQASLHSGAPLRVFSEFGARGLKQGYGVDAHIVPPIVDCETFYPRGKKDLSRPRILYTADLVQLSKGPHILALAFNHVHRRCPEAILQLAGPVGFHIPNVTGLLGLINSEARDSVELIGPGSLKDLPNLYSQAAVTVLPSLDEPFGMVLTESLASGTPVVGTNSGAIPEIVADEDIGTLFDRTDDPYESATNLAEALLRSMDLARKPDVVERCRTFSTKWTWPSVAPAFEELQRSAFSSTKEPGLVPV